MHSFISNGFDCKSESEYYVYYSSSSRAPLDSQDLQEELAHPAQL